MSVFADLSALDLQRIWDGVHVRAVHGNEITLGVIELDPDSQVPEHAHENEQLGMCLTGAVVFRVGEETRELGPGGTWSIPSNVPHEVHVGPQGAVVIDVFVPPRDDWRNADGVDVRSVRWPLLVQDLHGVSVGEHMGAADTLTGETR